MRAFPSGDQRQVEPEFGMSLRDYFAAQALSGLLSNDDWQPDHCASFAYRCADAMLEARK